MKNDIENSKGWIHWIINSIKDWFNYDKFINQELKGEEYFYRLISFFVSLIIYSIIFHSIIDSYKKGIIIGFIFSIILNLFKKYSFYCFKITFGAFLISACMMPVYLVIHLVVVFTYVGYKLFSILWNLLPN